MSDPKSALLERLAGMARAAGHAHRLRLLELIAQVPRSVESLAAMAELSVANTSRHLQQLRRAGLVTVTRQGRQSLYALADPAVLDLFAALQKLADRQLAEAEQLASGVHHAATAVEPIDRSALLARLRAGEVTLLDVRPPEEFRHGHLPGAVNIPPDALETHLATLPSDREIVAYCRGPFCMLSVQAAERLRAQGYRVRWLRDGYPEWQAAGLPVEHAP